MFSPPHYCCPDVHEKWCRYERLRKPVARDRISVPTTRTLLACAQAQLRSRCRNRGPHMGPTGPPGHVVREHAGPWISEGLSRPDGRGRRTGATRHMVATRWRHCNYYEDGPRTTYTTHGGAHETCSANENTVLRFSHCNTTHTLL